MVVHQFTVPLNHPFRLPALCCRILLLLSIGTALGMRTSAADWRRIFSKDLEKTLVELELHRDALSQMGDPIVGNTVPQLGYQHPQLQAPPPESPWIRIDLGANHPLDRIALVPALVDFQPLGRGAYGFPRRFRVDLSDDASFATFDPVLVHTDEDFPGPGAAPVVIRTEGRRARYIRITVTRLAEENDTFFFALAEVMALQGNRNLALRCAVKASSSVNIAPRWNAAFLTDGRTPLGPPIRYGRLPRFDAQFAGPSPDGGPAWMGVDLGSERTLDEVRLHPLHARQGADVPGFRFPAQFRVESALQADFADAHILFESRGEDFPNPGNNPVTINAEGVRARHVRVVLEKAEIPTTNTFALSEIEVHAEGKTVSFGCVASSSGDPGRNPPRPVEQLTDGSTSYGHIVGLPDWLDEWAHRAALMAGLRRWEARLPAAIAEAERRAAWSAIALLIVGCLAIGVYLVNIRIAKQRELEQFRTRLSQDLHDEIGSNLAGIARLSESALPDNPYAQNGDLGEIHRIACESSDAMREVLWLVGARQEMGIDLGQQMRNAAARLLPGRAIRWSHPPDALPTSWNIDTRRQIFLFFKEALTNVLRHAKASEVELSARVIEDTFELRISDNGRGFDSTSSTTSGLGLKNLRARAAALRGECVITSKPGEGTAVLLRMPV